MHEQEEVAFALIIGTLLFLFLCICLLLFFILFQNSKKRHIEEKKTMQLAYDNELANATIEIQENTLGHISRELHDNVGQLLTVAKIHLNSLTRYPEKRTNEKITETGDVVEKAINELRTLSKTLNPEKIKQFGLLDAVKLELSRINKLEIIQTNFVLNDEHRTLGADIEIIVFRIIQEFIANTIKYAKATQINIVLNYGSDKFVLEINDNGQGFNIHDQMGLGSGILNIKNRAALMEAECVFESEYDKGTSLTLTIGYDKLKTDSKFKIQDSMNDFR